MNKELEELFAKYKKVNSEPKSLGDQCAEWAGQFVAYLLIITLMFLCWNYALVPVFPVVPSANFFQVAGIWYLSAVILKRA
jgi:TRAP-type mannitol/chloroaromatic compound transport system permease small subunit